MLLGLSTPLLWARVPYSGAYTRTAHIHRYTAIQRRRIVPPPVYGGCMAYTHTAHTPYRHTAHTPYTPYTTPQSPAFLVERRGPMSLTSLSEGTSVAIALELRCSAACVWGVGPPCSGGLSGAGQPLAFARATRRRGGGWRALLSIGRGGGGGVRRRLRELCAQFPDRACALRSAQPYFGKSKLQPFCDRSA